MIINTTDKKLKVGDHIIRGMVSNCDKEYQELTFIVEREASLEEFIEYAGEYAPNTTLNMNLLLAEDCKFFKILTD